MFIGYLAGVLSFEDVWKVSQDRSSQDRSSQVSLSQDMLSQDRSSQDRSGQVHLRMDFDSGVGPTCPLIISILIRFISKVFLLNKNKTPVKIKYFFFISY